MGVEGVTRSRLEVEAGEKGTCRRIGRIAARKAVA